MIYAKRLSFTLLMGMQNITATLEEGLQNITTTLAGSLKKKKETFNFVLGYGSHGSERPLPAMGETEALSLGWEEPLEKGIATHSQYSCLENYMDRGAWQATVQGVSKSQTQLSD